MSQNPNPYVAPTARAEPAPSLPSWANAVVRIARTMITLDLARAVAWRAASVTQELSPNTPVSKVGTLNINVVLQLAFAITLAVMVFTLTRSAKAASPRLGPALRITALVACVLYVVRLLVAPSSELLAAQLAVVTMAADGAVILIAAAFVAKALTSAGDPTTGTRVRFLASIYAIATVGGIAVTANALIPATGSFPMGWGTTFRTLVTIAFIALAALGFGVLRKAGSR